MTALPVDTVLVVGAVRTAALVVEAQAAAPMAAVGVEEAPVHPAAVLRGAAAVIAKDLVHIEAEVRQLLLLRSSACPGPRTSQARSLAPVLLQCSYRPCTG